jgi:hypothetical protein
MEYASSQNPIKMINVRNLKSNLREILKLSATPGLR